MKTKLQFSAVLLIILSLTYSSHAQQSPSDPELKAEYHHFDFWLGEWDVYANGTENLLGKSLNTYNKSTGKWEQYWIDNGGLVLKL